MNKQDISINFLGNNPIKASEDTTATWKKVGNGFAYYNTMGLLKYQPCRFGLLVNRVVGEIVLQTFYSLHGRSESWTRAGNSKGWYPGSAGWIPTVSIASQNKNYPDYDDKWKWCKYSDGTFKAEYKISLIARYLHVHKVDGDMAITKFGVKLPMSVKDVDVPKWDVITDADGLIIVTSTEVNNEYIMANIRRSFVKNDESKITIGCTVTGKWK